MNGQSKGKVLTAMCVVMCWSFAVSCSSNGPSAISTLINGGFESGNIAPWLTFQTVQASIDSTHVHSGKFSLAESVAAGSTYQDLQGLKPGKGYTLSAWVSASPGTTATTQIAVFDADKNLASFSDPVKPTEAWQQIKYSFNGSSSGFDRIHLFRNAGDGTVYWDDVEITESK